MSRTTPVARTVALACALIVASAAAFAAQQGLSRRDADRLVEKMQAIAARDPVGRPAASRPDAPRAVLTPVSEAEVNAYLAYHARDQLPAGVVEPRITIVGAGSRLSGRAIVDLDGIKQQQPSRGLLDPMAYLGGKLPVSATGVLRATGGVARLELESVYVSGIRVPTMVLQELLTYYSRTPEDPDGLRLDDPFPLPAGIREIQLRPKEAIIVQ